MYLFPDQCAVDIYWNLVLTHLPLLPAVRHPESPGHRHLHTATRVEECRQYPDIPEIYLTTGGMGGEESQVSAVGSEAGSQVSENSQAPSLMDQYRAAIIESGEILSDESVLAEFTWQCIREKNLVVCTANESFSPERIPPREEIELELLKSFPEGPYEVVRVLEDENGISLFEIKVLDSEGGGWSEFSYVRKGIQSNGMSRIDVAFYDEDGIPVSGDTVAQLVDNRWVR